MADQIELAGQAGQAEQDKGLGSPEDRARRMGWIPEEEFKGHPDRWVDAETYIRNAENVLPHLRGTMNVLERKAASQERIIKELNEKLDGLRGDMSEFVQFSKQAEERAYAKAVKELQAKQRSAVLEGDVAAFDAVSAELEQHIAQHPAVTGKPKTGGEEKKEVVKNPWIDEKALAEWEQENKWYFEEPEMAIYADQMDRWLDRKEGTKISHAERLAKITELVKTKFPEKWENPKRKTAPAVTGSEASPADNGKRSYANLPPDAKALCDKWAGKDGKGTGTLGSGYTRDDYLKSYQWD